MIPGSVPARYDGQVSSAIVPSGLKLCKWIWSTQAERGQLCVYVCVCFVLTLRNDCDRVSPSYKQRYSSPVRWKSKPGPREILPSLEIGILLMHAWKGGR